MKKRIFYILIVLSVITATVTGILSSLVHYKFYVNQSKDQLKTVTELSAQENWDNYADINESVSDILKSVTYAVRVTVINKSGNVIYDNFADYETIENHKDRPEIKDAFDKGFGENTRLSKTMKNDTFYYAVKLENGTVLRLSRELNSVREVFSNIVPILISLFILIAFSAFIIASYITKKMVKPIKQMTGSIDELISNKISSSQIDIYEELEPFKNKIIEQKIKINEYINEIKHERDTIGVLTENMKEGFILINKDKNILSINASAKRMIGNEKFTLSEHKNIIELTRNPQIIKNINAATEKNIHIVDDVDTNRYHFRYYYSPVSQNSSEVDGLMILIEDITIQKNNEIMRYEFSSNVSHELKTPLTAIIGFAEMIKEGLVTDTESIKKYCGMINSEGLRLINLIEDIIRLSKIEERVDIDYDNFVNLKETAEEVFDLLNEKAEKNNVQLTLHAEDVMMKGNKTYISEMLYNLVDNAVKYNKKDGSVEVNIYKKNNQIHIDVKDSGLGIPEEHQDRIFERFYRVDKSRSKETGGTGLGLSIVKHISELYKGSISLSSRENTGTEIKIQFPL